MRLAIVAVLATISLSACGHTSVYAPMDGRYGFAEQRIEQNRFRVMFHGDSSTSRETVENFLLYRAAELTLENGYDYFLIEEGGTDIARSLTYIGPGAVYGYYPYGYHRFPYYAFGYSWAYDTSYRENRRFEAHAYILMYPGKKPADEPLAFDAREVVSNLKGRVEPARPRM